MSATPACFACVHVLERQHVHMEGLVLEDHQYWSWGDKNCSIFCPLSAITTCSSLICYSHWVMKLRNVDLILCVKEGIMEAAHGMSWIGLLTYSISMASILQVSGSSQVTRQRSSPMGHHLIFLRKVSTILSLEPIKVSQISPVLPVALYCALKWESWIFPPPLSLTLFLRDSWRIRMKVSDC